LSERRNVSSLLQLCRVGNVISGHHHRLEKGSDDVGVKPVWCLRSLTCFVAQEGPVGCEAKADGAEFNVLGGASSASVGVFVVCGVIDVLAIVAVLLKSVSHSETAKLVVGSVDLLIGGYATVVIVIQDDVLAETLVDGG
jgi:hypothetical protein